MVGARPVRHPVVVSLFWRVVAINAGGLVVAALVLALSPATVSRILKRTGLTRLDPSFLAVICAKNLSDSQH